MEEIEIVRETGQTSHEIQKEIAGMNKKILILFLASAVALIPLSWAPAASAARPAAQDEEKNKKDAKEIERVENAGKVLKEILDIPDNIPQDLLDKARCVIVIPSVVKAAFVVGGQYGRGVMVCRTGKSYTGPWGAPVFVALEGGSVGFQIGGQATDFVILVMGDRGADSLLHSKVKLGVDASIAAGPKGRDAQAATDASFRSEMLSYSRSRGVFAGVSLEGATLHPDDEANHRVYGSNVTAEEIIKEGQVKAPPAARTLISTLQRVSPQLKT
jgi:SH3 domain-containing YSC84-like protein 1